MSWTSLIIGLVIGFVLGIAVALVFKLVKTKTAKELAEEILRDSEEQRKSNVDAVIENVKAIFGSLSLDALSKSQEAFLNLAKERLESDRKTGTQDLEAKKGLIDQQLQSMTSQLEKVSTLMKELEKDREQKFGALTEQLKTASAQTDTLAKTTGQLHEALASSKVRGQWGERMAEDVLRIAGLEENLNYLKQKTIEEAGSRPDFTFLLPQDFKLNMDVKFPLDNYIRFCESNSDEEKAKLCSNFLKDAKARIKEVTTREYINPEQHTLDYVLLFIPNEQVYRFIHEQDSSVIDYGLENRVVLCSPITLFAVLVIIRHAIDNFTLQHRSDEILSLLGAFKKQWDEFSKRLEQLGKRIDAAQKEYGSLVTTRKRKLEKPLNEIDNLRLQLGLLPAPMGDDDSLLPSDDTSEDSEEASGAKKNDST